ncbi:MAG: SLBB domain-containing protein [Planctomycetota bacterium]
MPNAEWDPEDERQAPLTRTRVGVPTELGRPLLSDEPGAASSRAGSSTGGPGGGGVSFPDEITLNVNGIPIAGNEADTQAHRTLRPTAPSPLELQYRGQVPRRPDRNLEQFGYAQLDRIDAPVGAADGPASSDHVLVPGDEVVVDLTTDTVERFRAPIGPEGALELEGLVTVTIAGLRFDEAERVIRDEVTRVRRNFELSVTLGRLASVPVRIAGEALAPGVVEIGPRPTLLDALALAGVRRSGSLRRVMLTRADGEPTVVDLYGYLLGNESPPDIRLSRGDAVSILPIGPTIAIAGSVQRPAIYELLDSSRLSVTDAIRLAGGGTGFAVTDQVQIERTVEGQRILVDVEDNEQTTVVDGDLILVGAVDGRLHPIVEVLGEVAQPGRFQHRDGLTAGDLVRLAGGLTVSAFDGEAVISRVAGETARRADAWDAQTTPSPRRVIVIDLALALRGDPRHDVILEPLDLLRVRRFDEARETPTVELIGAARRPGVYELTAGMSASDLIALAGSLTPDAFREEAELVRRKRTEGDTILDVQRYRFALPTVLNGEDRGPALENGDRLIIRRLTAAEVRVRADGLVRFPGEYVLPAGARITDLIAAAGGLLPDADVRAAAFTRESVRMRQRDRWSELSERTRQVFEQNLERRVNSARAKEAFSARIQLQQAQATLDRLGASQTTGRIVLDFSDPEFPDSQGDLFLESGDALSVPRRTNTVTVQGHVFNPLTVVYGDDVSADQLISQAGGMTEIADRDRVYVVRADGRVASVSSRHGRFALRDPLLPGDVVLVPPRPLDRDAGSVALDLLLLARTAGEAAALWNLATQEIDDGSVSIIDTPASPRSDSTPPSEIIREFQR